MQVVCEKSCGADGPGRGREEMEVPWGGFWEQ